MPGVSNEIAAQAVRLRQKRKTGSSDSLIAATALANDLTLVTRSTKDFKWIKSLTSLDPFEDQ